MKNDKKRTVRFLLTACCLSAMAVFAPVAVNKVFADTTCAGDESRGDCVRTDENNDLLDSSEMDTGDEPPIIEEEEDDPADPLTDTPQNCQKLITETVTSEVPILCEDDEPVMGCTDGQPVMGPNGEPLKQTVTTKTERCADDNETTQETDKLIEEYEKKLAELEELMKQLNLDDFTINEQYKLADAIDKLYGQPNSPGSGSGSGSGPGSGGNPLQNLLQQALGGQGSGPGSPGSNQSGPGNYTPPSSQGPGNYTPPSDTPSAPPADNSATPAHGANNPCSTEDVAADGTKSTRVDGKNHVFGAGDGSQAGTGTNTPCSTGWGPEKSAAANCIAPIDNAGSRYCGQGVGNILEDLGYPITRGNGNDWAKNLEKNGWKKLEGATPTTAPPGAVLTYNSDGRAGKRNRGTGGGSFGHVEIVTEAGGRRKYVSDAARANYGGTVPDNFMGAYVYDGPVKPKGEFKQCTKNVK